LPSSPITVNLSVAASAVIPFTLTVKNANGCTSSNIIGNVIVNTIITQTCATATFTGAAPIAPTTTTAGIGGTGGLHIYTVPAGVTAIRLDARGAKGGNTPYFLGGNGGRVQATYTVAPGDVLYILIGGKGGDGAPDNDVVGNDIHKSAAGGGGGTFISKGPIGTGTLLLVAGGGGGAGDEGGGGVPNNTPGNGAGSIAAGGGSFSADGSNSNLDNNCGKGGKAVTNGGNGGANTCFKPSSNSGGYGGGGAGNDEFANRNNAGGGGGGGYVGGNGGGRAGGNGGSSYNDPSASNPVIGNSSDNNGSVIITIPATITYTGSPFCKSLTTTGVPTTTGYTGGTFSSTSGLTIDANTGVINPSTSTAGTYTVTYNIPNLVGCPAVTTTVTINALPTATASNNSPICSGITLNLIGGGVGAYSWTSSSGFTSTAQSPSIPSATASMSGTYTITVTNVNGCTSTATTSVTVNPVTATPTPQANTQIIFGASITLTATGCSGVNDVLKWYKSSDNSLATMPVSPTATTNFYAKCETTLNGITCISGNSTDVTVTVLSPNPPVATGATNCLGTPTTLTATGCSGSVGTFVLKWYQNADDALVTMPVSPLVSTDYYAKCEQTFNSVTAISAKSNVVTLTILNPPTPVSTGGTIYNGQSISLTATGCTGTLGTFTLRWYQTADNALVTMPVSPTVTTQYYSKCEQVANSVTCLSPKSNDVTLTVVNRIFVDITKVAAPIQNGNSWATAYGNLQTGLAAATAGVEVWVAKGTYKPTTTTTRTIYFNIPSSVIVYGGFAGTEDYLIDRNFRTNVSILSGDIGTLNLTDDNTYHVVSFSGSSNTTVLDGFTVTGGNASFDPKINGLPLAANSAPSGASIQTGGGILIYNTASPIISNCTIIKNNAWFGAGIFCVDASTPTIRECNISNNESTFGAAIYAQGASNFMMKNVLMAGNKGIGCVYNNTSNPILTNCTIASNGGYNGGIFNSASQPVIKNSILWGNATPFNDTQSIITYSTVQGGYPGVGNLTYDPQLVNPAAFGPAPNTTGDYHLKAASLAIDRGNNGSISLTDKDLDGNLRRFAGGVVDMGAYEFQGVGTSTLVISVVTGPWEANSTWSVGRVPQLGDYVIIDNNHIVTLNSTGIAKNLEYRGTGQLKFNTTTSKIEIGF
jgi:parallel beta-helix repeat protein